MTDGQECPSYLQATALVPAIERMLLLEPTRRPLDAACEGVQKDRVGKGFVGVAVRRAENSSFAVLIRPQNRVQVAGLFADR